MYVQGSKKQHNPSLRSSVKTGCRKVGKAHADVHPWMWLTNSDAVHRQLPAPATLTFCSNSSSGLTNSSASAGA